MVSTVRRSEPSFPEEGNETISNTIIDLQNRLDTLWITYLDHLDKYVAAQDSIQTKMSAGFMSLARANFNARHGVRRYGKDFFSERAVASSRVEVSTGEDGERLKLDIVRSDGIGESNKVPIKPENANSKIEMANESEDPKQTQQPSPPPTPMHRQADESTADERDTQSTKSGSETIDTDSARKSTTAEAGPSVPIDPLRWFGILVPPDLRAAQASFVTAIDKPVSDAVNAARQMRELEVEIRKLRKEIRRSEKANSHMIG